MPLSQNIQTLMNEQIKHEFYSSYLYLSMAAWFEAGNLGGSARWMRIQSQEESGHAMKFFDHLLDRGGRVTLGGLEQPPAKFASPLEIFEQAHQHEQAVSAKINAIYAAAVKEGDYATQGFLDWFVREQVEEEKTSAQILETLRMVGDNRAALIMLDRELGRRAGE